MKKTAWEIVNEVLVVDCYLCGKGKISIKAGDLKLSSPHPLEHKVRYEMQKFLLSKLPEFFEKLK